MILPSGSWDFAVESVIYTTYGDFARAIMRFGMTPVISLRAGISQHRDWNFLHRRAPPALSPDFGIRAGRFMKIQRGLEAPRRDSGTWDLGLMARSIEASKSSEGLCK